MPPASPSFSQRTIAVLRTADRRLRATERGELPKRYGACRSGLTGLGPVDAFFISFFRGEDQVVLVYVFDGELYLSPEVLRLTPGGVSAWVRMSRRPYHYNDDNGAKLHRGAPLGDASRMSADAVVVPLLDVNTGDVLGMMSAQSYTPNSFDAEFVRAMEWMARALMQMRDRDERETESLGLYELYPELDSARILSEADLVNRIGDRLTTLRAQLTKIMALAGPAGHPELLKVAEESNELCATLQHEVADLVLVQAPTETHDLTAREIEVATLIVTEGMTNAAIAERLHISEKTVKTHVGNILKKLGISQRSAIEWTLPPGLIEQAPTAKAE